LRERIPAAACRIYAPVGGHRDLLAYLVRRLLENGANSSFVSVAADPAVPVETILQKPRDQIGDASHARHPRIPLSRDLYGAARRNSPGVEFGDQASLDNLLRDVRDAMRTDYSAAPLIGGKILSGSSRAALSPVDGESIGTIIEADAALAAKAMDAAVKGFQGWSATPADTRAAALERAAGLLEQRRGLFIALMQREGGKTLDDAVSEWREAIDYCRYYAANARETLKPAPMPGPTGERNELRYRGRGVFVCISPWNFPLAIFMGQVVAALVGGNAVVAKPAEQTPLIAFETIRLLHEAGVSADALHLLPGDGKVGAALVADARAAGVAFTGSTEVGHAINRSLASKNGPIVPLIAETGGINAMIVDATALPEQVTDDVITSAFRSAGQRCSALRLLCVQDDIAERLIEMIAGAARELKLGDPSDPSTHVGPVIDRDAKERLDAWISKMGSRVLFRWNDGQALPPRGLYVPPTIIRLNRASDLTEEVFGPVLHVVRWQANALDALLSDIAGNGTGLTLGVHSRIEMRADHIAARLSHGNVYVNRSMIGAVVGTQPFGGHGLSGTGPKAGGPNYLRRFVTEQTVTINTAAAGGNATLLAEPD
jgi:RHH-type proline utilization regulon transcriptional repressor/proline dehydrogenase/delta 1-pyrroline-5-carboxylate dehydrogenase